jgi:hypothetical protein
MEVQCGRCGAAMSCNPGGDCWCAQPPHVLAPVPGTRCLCPKCLNAEIEKAAQQSEVRPAEPAKGA